MCIFFWFSLQVICYLLSYIVKLIVKGDKLCYNCVRKVGETVAKGKISKKNNKKAKKRIFLSFIFFGAIIGSLSYSFFTNVGKIIEIKNEKQALNVKLSDLKDEEEALNSDIKKLNDPDYVARYAREKYLYSKNGELIIRIPDDE